MTVGEYNACVDSFADGLYRFILKNIRDEENAKDIVQEFFVRLWEKHKVVNFEKSKSYLFTTAYHLMIDEIRKERYKSSSNDFTGLTSHYDPRYSDLSQILDEAVNRLPEIQRIVVMLRDYEGYSYKEIGEITKLSEPQVKVYIYRARMALKHYIGSVDLVI